VQGTWLSLLPPFISIILALTIRKVIPSLIIGILSGVFLLHGFGFSAMGTMMDTYIVNAIYDKPHIYIILFTLLIGGMVSLLHFNGGMRGLVDLVSDKIKSAKSTQFYTFVLGICIFFDDYANALIVGNSMGPLADKYKVSREKLAYIVDSTSAPIACIAFVTTWIGAEIGYIQDAVKELGLSISAYEIFLNSIKYSFYSFFTLLFILILIFLEKDFGPMLQAEKDAKDRKMILKNDTETGRPFSAIIPVLTLILITFFGLVITGMANSDPNNINFRTIISNADSFKALLWGSGAALFVAVLITLKTQKSTKVTDKIFEGFSQMFESIVILILSWSLALVMKDLKASAFLIQFVDQNMSSPLLFGVIIFIIAGLTSFATGSSWGTMAILYPLALPISWELAHKLQLSAEDSLELISSIVAFVLGGAVFGDHCSPISDTTILSSMACKCNHVHHVRTQLPYALTTAGVSLCSIFIFELTNSLLLTLGLGFTALFAIVYFFGKKIT